MFNDFEYVRPTSLEEAITLARTNRGRTSYLAGGTDLIANIKNELLSPEALIDLKGINELSDLSVDDSGLFIGATVSISAIMDHEAIAKRFPPLVDACRRLASHQVRNRATLAGNVCNASPCANSVPALCVLGAEVVVYDGKETSSTPVHEFIQGVKTTSLPDKAIVTGLRIPAQPADARGGFMEKTRMRGPDIGSASVACLVSREESRVRVALGSLSPRPVVLNFDALFNNGSSGYEERIENVLREVRESISPISDIRSTGEYRRAIAEVYTRRLVSMLWESSN